MKESGSVMISVIVPCYNEIEVIGETHRRLSQCLEGITSDWEIVYVDDGSRDGTVAALTALSLDEPRVLVVRLARNSVNGLMRIRKGILSRLLTIPNHANHRVLEVDRTRRRCDRWTDMLLGPIANLSGCYEFAFDAERARDFGEESFVEDRLTGPNVAEHLVAAGMRLKFVQYLPDDMVSEPELICLSQSILSSIPKLNFHRDGSFRSVLERQVAASRHRMEQRAVIAQTPYEIEDVPQMRIDLSKKRREDES